MSAAAITLQQVRYENKAFWRNPASVFFTFVFPLMFLFIFNGFDLGPGAQFYVPAIAALSVITATYTNLAISVSFLRDEGVLKRLHGSPLPPAAFLLARVIHATFVSIILVTIIALAGRFLFDVELPSDTLPAFVVSVIVGAATFCALGLAFTSVIPNSDAAPPMVNFSVLPLLFISGVFLPTESAPEWLQNIADVFPVKHLADALNTAFNPFGRSGWETSDLLIVALWGIAGVLLAIRFFTWEPRR
jgi:ABC-2 type transport system permease protein